MFRVRSATTTWAGPPTWTARSPTASPGSKGTPYSGFYLAENGVRAFSSGVRYDLGAGLGLRLEGTRRESALGAAGAQRRDPRPVALPVGRKEQLCSEMEKFYESFD